MLVKLVAVWCSTGGRLASQVPVALYVVLMVGCKSPHTLTPPPGCEDADLITCLQPFAGETLSASALARFRVEAI